MTVIDIEQIDYKNEIYRKLIHFASLSIPIVYYHIPQEPALWILGIMTVISLSVDIGRFTNEKIRNLLYPVFGGLFRKHELDPKKWNLSGSSYLLIAAFICVLIFPKIIVVTCMSFLIIGDAIAALIGRKYGKTPFLKKSLEGTFAFFVCTILIVLVIPKQTGSIEEYMIGFVCGAFAAIIENVSSGWVDDNISIPVFTGIIMWGLYLFFSLPLTLN